MAAVARKTTRQAKAAPLAEKLRFLARPESYPHNPPTVEVMETHMSVAFLAGDRSTS
ncbi:hypothetical protein [Aurantimonas sp. 22II-16-19i]|uniref:hypothetical protein n=1 Tax=Aurantimonas sp. 22II-16-19i TaxID=1317114 RepID=UPI001592F618|nr:hypothetical protein [Aurantimonas sp. 22II-16-19i]